MKRWVVTLTKTRHYTLIVEAEDANEAILRAAEMKVAEGYPSWWSYEGPDIRMRADPAS